MKGMKYRSFGAGSRQVRREHSSRDREDDGTILERRGRTELKGMKYRGALKLVVGR